jgi:hypothetical protein
MKNRFFCVSCKKTNFGARKIFSRFFFQHSIQKMLGFRETSIALSPGSPSLPHAPPPPTSRERPPAKDVGVKLVMSISVYTCVDFLFWGVLFRWMVICCQQWGYLLF